MKPSTRRVHDVVAAAVVLMSAGCGSAGARLSTPPAAATVTAAPTPAPEVGHHPAPAVGDAADIRFMQDMIVHHAQALTMTALVPSRTATDAVRLLAERMTIAQRDEIGMMERWLRRRATHLPPADSSHRQHMNHADMPGMLTRDDLARLAGAAGQEFDRLFLLLMIRHHAGALTMVEQLFATPGAAQDTAVYFLAADIDADQRAEIARMRMMLERMAPAR